MQLATKYSSEIAETPFIQRVLRPVGRPLPIVGNLDVAPRGLYPVKTAPHPAAVADRTKAQQPSRYARRKEKERLVKFQEAVAFAYAMDWPLNIGITITWAALLEAGEHKEGHCLARAEWDREHYARDELARLCRSEGLPFVALWGRDVGKDMGLHVHLSIFWPCYKLAKLVAVIERISGSSAAFVLRPYTADTVARSICGGWQINMNNRKNDKASALEWAGYIAEQHAKHPARPEIKGKAFGISQVIGNSAQERARPMLEAREAKYGWMRNPDSQQPPEAHVSPLRENKGAEDDEDRERQAA